MKLNKIERLKEALPPYRFEERLHRVDLKALTEEDRFYLKNYGIYNIKLAPERFMLRLRVPAGRISFTDMESIVSIATEEGLELLLTTRSQLELHGLDAENVLSVWQKLRERGITTLQTLTDNFRNIITDPYDGRSQENRVAVSGLITRMQESFLYKPEWMGMLPRKFNTAICGTESVTTHFFGNDLYFALARKEGAWGFNLYLGGKNSEAAQPADIFVLPDEVPSMFLAVAEAYRTYGLREARSRTRLFHLLEVMGMTAFREKITEFYPGTLVCAGETHVKKQLFHPFERLHDGSWGYCLQSRFGKIGVESLAEVVTFAKAKKLEIRIGADQNLYLLGLKEKNVPFAPVVGASHVTACAGSSHCALSLWDVKAETAYLPLEKIEQHQLQVGFSGCLKGCGRHHHCDIGLVGLRTNLFGQTQKAARVFLGGQYSSGGMPARLIFPSVPLKHLSGLLEVIIESYEASGEKDFERFSIRWLNSHSTFFVMLWFLSQLYLEQPPKLEQESEAKLYEKLAACEDFPLFEDDENYLQSIKVMMHALWDDEVNEK
jgi:ferredoxin-nitrite reductase